MFVIFGVSALEKQWGMERRHCLKCGQVHLHTLHSGRPWFTLYFLPVLPLSWLRCVARCSLCAQEHPEPFHPAPRWASQARRSAALLWGWLFTIIGGLLSLMILLAGLAKPEAIALVVFAMFGAPPLLLGLFFLLKASRLRALLEDTPDTSPPEASLEWHARLGRLQSGRSVRLAWGWVLAGLGGFWLLLLAAIALFGLATGEDASAVPVVLAGGLCTGLPFLIPGVLLLRRARQVGQELQELEAASGVDTLPDAVDSPPSQALIRKDTPMIRLTCPKCGKRVGVKDEEAGKRVTCPACGEQWKASATLEKAPAPTEASPADPASHKAKGEVAGTFEGTPEALWEVVAKCVAGNSAYELLGKDRDARTVKFRMKTGGLIVTVLLSDAGDKTEVAFAFDDSQVSEKELVQLGQWMPGFKHLPPLEAGKKVAQAGAQAVVLTALESLGQGKKASRMGCVVLFGLGIAALAGNALLIASFTRFFPIGLVFAFANMDFPGRM